MIPRILEYEDGRLKVTPEAFIIPETRAILDKYDMDAEPYLAYVYMMSYPDSPYNYLSVEERSESAIFDVKETIGDFDNECELIQPAVKKLTSLWRSPNVEAADELEEELRRWVNYLKITPTGGEEMKNRFSVTDKFEKLAQSAANLRKLADEEIKTKMKGANELGEY